MSAAPRSRIRRDVDGILLLDKPSGMTSNAALQTVKRLFEARKAGHTGSLDPLASGMLPLCFGEATKFAGHLLDADKTYRVRARFGTRTDTGDADGQVVETQPKSTVAEADLERALATLRGPILQVPPMYSALKKGGQRLYTLARAGVTVDRAARPVTIHAFEVAAYDPGCPELEVRCSKGTYVRTLVEDLAAELGTVGHVAELRRTAVAPFPEEQMVPIAAVVAAAGESASALDRLLLAPDAGLAAWPVVDLGPADAASMSCGRAVPAPAGHDPGPVRVFGTTGFMGIGEVLADGLLAPRRMRSTAGHDDAGTDRPGGV